MEQKKINNFDYVEKVVVQGAHKRIITVEDFERVQQILSTKSASVNNKGARGKHTSNDVWCKKLKCSCGSSFNRRVWRRIDNVPQYAYQCYRQINSGTIATRLKKGLSIEGICDVPMIPGWKLGAMADVIFQKFWSDREGVIRIANEILEKHFDDDREVDFSDEIQDTQKKINVLNKKFDNLVDMRMSGEITKEKFSEKKKYIDSEIERLSAILSSYQVEEDVSDDAYKNKLEVIKYGLEQDFNFSTHSIPEEIIDAFVNEIVAYNDCFVWKLNLFDNDVKTVVHGRKSNATISLLEYPNVVPCSTGGSQPKVGDRLFGKNYTRFCR